MNLTLTIALGLLAICIGLWMLMRCVGALARVITPGVDIDLPVASLQRYPVQLPRAGRYEVAMILPPLALRIDPRPDLVELRIETHDGDELRYRAYSRWNLFSGQRADFRGRTHHFIGDFVCPAAGDYLFTLLTPPPSGTALFGVSTGFSRPAFLMHVLGTVLGASLLLLGAFALLGTLADYVR